MLQKPPPCVEHLLVDLRLKLVLELVEGRVDLRLVAGALHDLENASLNVYAALDHAQHFITRAEHALEQVELLVEQLMNPPFGVVF